MTKAWIAFALASGFFLFEFVTRIEPSLATDAISTFYGLKPSGFGTLASLFFWIYAPMQIVVGLALDRLGARRLILLGSCACAAGVLLFAATDVIWIGGLGRLLTGFGASFAFVSALWLVNHWFPPERFALLSGLVNAVGMLGTAIGAVALSDIVDVAGWRAVFLSTGIFGIILATLIAIFLREPPSPAQDSTGGPVQHVRDSLAAILGEGRLWAISVVGLLYYMPVNVFGGLWGTTELVHDHHFSQVEAETAVSMIFWGMAAGSVIGGWLSDALGHRKYLVFGGAILTALAYGAALYLPVSALMMAALLFAAGLFGGLQMLTFAMAKEGLDNSLVGTVVAFVNMVGIAGALIFQPLVGVLAEMAGGDFRLALTTVPVCAILAAGIILFVAEYRHPDHRPEGGN